MNENELDFLSKMRFMAEELSQFQIEYWQTFSGIGAWQFWVQLLMLIVPLIVLFIFIDKDKMLLLGFFGLNYHVWFSYVNSIGVDFGLWQYPYQLVPSLPSFSLDAALVPIIFMLLYQWTINHEKNIYLYSLLLSAILAFVLKPIMVKFDFFHMFHGINYIHLFLFYMVLFIISKFITNLFVWLQKKGRKEGNY